MAPTSHISELEVTTSTVTETSSDDTLTLTSFEAEKVLPKCWANAAMIRNISEFEKTIEETWEIVTVRMLNLNRVFVTPKGTRLNLTIVVQNDKSFYLQVEQRLTSTQRQELPHWEKPDRNFISSVDNIKDIISKSNESGMSPEKVKEELDAVLDM